MSTEFEEKIKEFIAAGNIVEGRPTRVAGKFELVYLKGKNSKIIFGNGSVLNSVSINMEQGDGNLHFGEDTYIRGRYFVGAQSTIAIGNKTAMNRHSLFVATEKASITIGNGCLISDISMSTTDWHSIIDDESGKRINPAKDIIIEDSVWLGEAVTIQKGITIGKNSIIGAKALVTKPIPPGSLVVGMPAKIIRSGVRWQRELIPMDSLPAANYE
ncbi:acyltransferase [Pantoea sp. SM3]|uniref:acyltransferase n=1 Tax=Pantoea sp. SM3 TaxID=1628192 RepID=UPI000699028F|nr:acyltransferase [Pantoea sp. SM3]